MNYWSSMGTDPPEYKPPKMTEHNTTDCYCCCLLFFYDDLRLLDSEKHIYICEECYEEHEEEHLCKACGEWMFYLDERKPLDGHYFCSDDCLEYYKEENETINE